jgi:hypothetical protein
MLLVEQLTAIRDRLRTSASDISVALGEKGVNVSTDILISDVAEAIRLIRQSDFNFIFDFRSIDQFGNPSVPNMGHESVGLEGINPSMEFQYPYGFDFLFDEPILNDLVIVVSGTGTDVDGAYWVIHGITSLNNNPIYTNGKVCIGYTHCNNGNRWLIVNRSSSGAFEFPWDEVPGLTLGEYMDGKNVLYYGNRTDDLFNTTWFSNNNASLPIIGVWVGDSIEKLRGAFGVSTDGFNPAFDLEPAWTESDYEDFFTNN